VLRACIALYPIDRLVTCTESRPPFPPSPAQSFDETTIRRLDFWETSRDEATGEIRFRRQTQLIARTDDPAGDTASTTALPMGRLVRAPPQPEERFVERFEARDIVLDDESESIRDLKRSMATEDDKSGAEWVHAK